ncbi:MAG: respiratory nitrate reductase subunit beta [Gammaproteobacteria bacterium]|nr:respiratory nitrate reductase subunit beta [Gammaproteobacteria bacterium]NIU05482.1 respiratory nitrate reductase subunit beta [Gammaproteobacteria bacterium]NIV52628.1 respiratory nitrate reductase subunit beta [Gammaproteobacteria bacterium]NIX86755.1 respiratory nitrate reductase subunit beta [Gammaproteobacteria bacterium]
MATINKQVRMIFDLNKCLGCHTCSMACKTMWTDRNPGQMYMYWNNVETHPGEGYPRSWQTLGGGFDQDTGELDLSALLDLLTVEGAYGAAWEYNYDEVLQGSASQVAPSPAPDGADAYASNWQEDVGAGSGPGTDAYYFYLPRICNHCTHPACVAACPRQALYKRAEDGIVLLDQDRCRGYRYCVEACPYKKIYWNALTKKSEKCIFCYPRVEQGQGNFCVTQCPGRIRWVGYAEDTTSNVYKLVDVWRVGLRLHPEFGTEPNTFYIPPFSPPTFSSDGGPVTNNPRIPIAELASLFGDNAAQTQADREARIQEVFDIIEQERARVRNGGSSELIDILVSTSESDRIQV